MQLYVNRNVFADDHTNGVLTIDSNPFKCFTLEDVVRPAGEKVMGKTAIPAGTYKVVVNWSPRKQKLMPRLLDVPGFEGILIHTGNTIEDTMGCLLVGGELLPNGNIKAGTSTPAFTELFKLLRDAVSRNESILITITNNR